MSMRFSCHSWLAVIVVLIILSLPKGLNADANRERLHLSKSFAFGIGTGVLSNYFDSLKNYDLVVVDAEEATTAQVKVLKDSGVIVLGYLSIGTIERGRFWYKKAKPYRLDYWQDFAEWYANTSDARFRDLIMKKVLPRFVKKGFDGIFLDNVDMIREHKKQKNGMRILVRRIAKHLHAKHLYVFAQNGEDVFGQIFNWLDGWNREDVSSTFNFDSEEYELLPSAEITSNLISLQSLIAKGLFVTTTDYVQPGDISASAQALANSCSAGAVPFISNIELSIVPTEPFLCTAATE